MRSRSRPRANTEPRRAGGDMNIIHRPETAARPEPAQRFVLHNLRWDDYEKILAVVGNRRIRVTYDRGSLELMSPLPIHESYKRYFGLLLGVLSEELGVPVRGLGSTTFRRRDADRGLEPDEC